MGKGQLGKLIQAIKQASKLKQMIHLTSQYYGVLKTPNNKPNDQGLTKISSKENRVKRAKVGCRAYLGQMGDFGLDSQLVNEF